MFEWDEAKRLSNIEKHGLDFLDADLLFSGTATPDFRDIPANWHAAAEEIMPAAKRLLSLRLDTEMVDWFRDRGPGYQTRIHAVLRAFVTQQSTRKA